jgi:hypothetical protein
VLAAVVGAPAAAAPLPRTAPDLAPRRLNTVADLLITLSQSAISYDPATNRSRVAVSVTPFGAEPPWSWSVAVRGTVVASGATTDASVRVTVTNACSITSMSVTTRVVDSLGRAAGAASTLDPSLCPPPPAHAYTSDRILARPTLNEASFVDRLRAVGSPALGAGPAIYEKLVGAGVNPAFALGTFQAESSSGTRGYAVITKNWGNILFYKWTAAYGATPYAPGNGYTYAKFPTWRAGVRAYVALLNRYWSDGYRTVRSASARWLGTRVGSDRHLRYLANIVSTMRILPDDARPVMTDLRIPASSGAVVTVRWSASDHRGVAGYQVKRRKGSRPWSARMSVTSDRTVLTLTSGTWTIAVRARDVAGNWSRWRLDTVKVDAG